MPFDGRALRRDPWGCPRGMSGRAIEKTYRVGRRRSSGRWRRRGPGRAISCRLGPRSWAPRLRCRPRPRALTRAGPHVRDARSTRTPTSRQNYAVIAARSNRTWPWEAADLRVPLVEGDVLLVR